MRTLWHSLLVWRSDCALRWLLAKKEAKRLEKEAKLAAKTAKVGASTPAGEKKAKAEKAKKEEEPAFVNTTPKGEKKGACQHHTYKLSHLKRACAV